MTDADALLAAVLAEPERDDVRLVYADFLEEHGEPERAEFVRVQLAVARIGQGDHNYSAEEIRRGAGGDPRCGCVWCRLRRREGELLAAHGTEWVALLAAACGVDLAERPRRWGWNGCLNATVQWAWGRGFVEAVRCPLADWRAHGPAVVRCQPVTRVDETSITLWTISPGPLAGYRCWARVDLPPGVWDLLKADSKGTAAVVAMYPTEADARAALSAALLAWAKRPKEG